MCESIISTKTRTTPNCEMSWRSDPMAPAGDGDGVEVPDRKKQH